LEEQRQSDRVRKEELKRLAGGAAGAGVKVSGGPAAVAAGEQSVAVATAAIEKPPGLAAAEGALAVPEPEPEAMPAQEWNFQQKIAAMTTLMLVSAVA
ncbi:MAG TPA: hypothetical protein VL860_07785, partial [Planctomycetota bacterium]|nr:hypothetical protein [Planctomycetota bacterium]